MKRLSVLVLAILLLAITTTTFAASSYTVTSVDNIIDNGGGIYNVQVTINVNGWTNDGGGIDYAGTVYYDCLGNLLGYYGELHFSDYSGPVSWYTFNFGNAPGPYRADVYDTTTPPTNAGDLLAGTQIGSFPINLNDTGVCDPAPSGDVDGDGIITGDNCPTVYNPGQEDGWGGVQGDACDQDRYNKAGIQVQGFVQKDGSFNLHGNCVFFSDGAASCPVIASFDPDTFTPASMPQDVTSDTANGWSVWVYFLYSTDGVDVYQVNTYRSAVPQPDTLIDDQLEIHVRGSIWKWMQRG